MRRALAKHLGSLHLGKSSFLLNSELFICKLRLGGEGKEEEGRERERERERQTDRQTDRLRLCPQSLRFVGAQQVGAREVMPRSQTPAPQGGSRHGHSSSRVPQF